MTTMTIQVPSVDQVLIAKAANEARTLPKALEIVGFAFITTVALAKAYEAQGFCVETTAKGDFKVSLPK